MRAGGCTVQQTLTAEAAGVVKNAVALARQRGHAQVTPLHVAATLLSPGSTNLLRRACVKSHAHSTSHPLQCRALELCFKVALNRLPTTAGPLIHSGQPPLSNSLVAVLKRAQAQQRRGCLEQQQQPLLAMKVEIEQLVISILDDPSVSRVMREAGFSSTSVKSNIEEEVSVPVNFPCFSMDHSNNGNEVPVSRSAAKGLIAGAFETGCNVVYGSSNNRSSSGISFFENPMFGSHRSGGRLKSEDVESVFEVLVGKKSRRINSVIVGDCSVTTRNVVREVMSRIERGDVPDILKGVQFLDPDFASLVRNGVSRDEVEQKLAQLRGTVTNCLVGGSAIIFAGDLRWAVENGDNNNSSHNRYSSNNFSCVQYITMELGRILSVRGESRRVWLMATASYQTYVTCFRRQPSLENLWGLQAVSVPRGGLDLSLQPCLTSEGEPKNNRVGAEALIPIPENHLRPMPFLKMIHPDDEVVEKLNCCYQCSANFEEEAKFVCKTEQSLPSSDPTLPFWLQRCRNRNASSEPDAAAQEEEAKLRELRKKWNQACRSRHCHYYDPMQLQRSALEPPQHPASMISSPNHSSPWWRAAQNNASGAISASRNMESSSVLLNTMMPRAPDCADSPLSWQTPDKVRDSSLEHPASVKDSTRVDVETTLTLGLSDTIFRGNDDEAKNRTASVSSSRPLQFEINLRQFDQENLKELSERLLKKVPWQSEDNIHSIARAVLQSRSGMVNRESRMMNKVKGDTWLLLLGADRMGKRKMAQALAEIIYGSPDKLICLASPWSRAQIDLEPFDLSLRGKTYLDRLTQAIANNPHSVVLLDDMEQADALFVGAIVKAMERGKLIDSNGREVSLCDTIVFMTSTLGAKYFANSCSQLDEEKLSKSIARCSRGLKLDVQERVIEQVEDKLEQHTCKRKIEWDLLQANETLKRKRNSPPLDLNVEQDQDAGSTTGNSDVTEETDTLSDHFFRYARDPMSEIFFKLLDACIIFRPFDFSQLAESVQDKLHHSYYRATNGRGSFEVDGPVVERMVCLCWELAPFGTHTFDKWVEEIFEVGLVQMLSTQTVTEKTTVKLSEAETNEGDSFYGNSLLPSRLEVTGCSNCQSMADEFTVCRMNRHHSSTKALIQVRA